MKKSTINELAVVFYISIKLETNTTKGENVEIVSNKSLRYDGLVGFSHLPDGIV